MVRHGVWAVFVFNSETTSFIKSEIAAVALLENTMPETNIILHEDSISKVIDKILLQVFGEKGTKMIYNYLETRYGLQQCEFCKKIDVFATGLESFLRSSAPLLERKILGDICATRGLPQRFDSITEQGFDFADEMRFLMHS